MGTWTYRHPVFVWTVAWGVTGAALYISGVFNSPRDGPLWVALTGGMISWSIAGVSTFSKHWNLANLVIWALAYLISFALAGFFLHLSVLSNTIVGLLIAFTGWSAGAALGAFASTWLFSDQSKLKQSAVAAGIWMVGFFAGSFISFTVAFLAAELTKIFIGFLIGVPAALIVGFGLGCALGGFVASTITVNTTRVSGH